MAESEIGKHHLQSLVLLFEAYEPQYWYWEVIETIKRIMLTGVLVLIAQGTAAQIVVGICFGMFFRTLYDTYPLFADPTVGHAETVAQWQILCVFFLALLVKADFASINKIALDVLLILAVFANILIFICKFVVWRYIQHRSQVASTTVLTQCESEMMSPFNAGVRFNQCLVKDDAVSGMVVFTGTDHLSEDVTDDVRNSSRAATHNRMDINHDDDESEAVKKLEEVDCQLDVI